MKDFGSTNCPQFWKKKVPNFQSPNCYVPCSRFSVVKDLYITKVSPNKYSFFSTLISFEGIIHVERCLHLEFNKIKQSKFSSVYLNSSFILFTRVYSLGPNKTSFNLYYYLYSVVTFTLKILKRSIIFSSLWFYFILLTWIKILFIFLVWYFVTKRFRFSKKKVSLSPFFSVK